MAVASMVNAARLPFEAMRTGAPDSSVQVLHREYESQWVGVREAAAELDARNAGATKRGAVNAGAHPPADDASKVKALRQEREAASTEAAERDSSILQGNPLLDPTRLGASAAAGGSFAVKRRWDDDVVFKNQSREAKKERTFINDTVRNDFHRRFLSKYIK